MRCKYSVRLVRRNHAKIRKASSAPVHGFNEPVSIDTDIASDTFEQVGDPSSSNSGGVEQVEQPEHENPGQMEQPEYENPERHATPEIGLRRSSRNRTLPSRFTYYVINIS